MYTVTRVGRSKKRVIVFRLLLLVLAVILGILFYLSNSNLNNTREQLANTRYNLDSTQTNLSETQLWLTNNETLLSRTISGYAYTLNDPSSAQMKAFLAQDQTDKHIYNATTYDCFNFAADTTVNASKEHIRCGLVLVNLIDGAHACIVFNTTDDRLVFVEPQSDDIVNLQIGKEYWRSISGHRYVSFPSDTVSSYTIIW